MLKLEPIEFGMLHYFFKIEKPRENINEKNYMSVVNKLGAVVIVLMISGGTLNAVAAQKEMASNASDFSNSVGEIGYEIKRNSDDIEIIRRDEINYKLENDLLKEVYSSHIEYIGFIISVVSGAVGLFFATLGYLGLKSVGKLKEDYSAELDKFRQLRLSLELEIGSIRKKQEETEYQVAKLSETQESKIKLLELTEKIGTLVTARNFEWALEHAKVASEIDPNYPPLVRLRAMCNMGLRRYPEAIEEFKFLFSTERYGAGDTYNYAEILLVSVGVDQYDDFYATHKIAIDSAYNGALKVFFNALKAILRGDINRAKHEIKSLADTSAAGVSAKLPGWSFEDAALVISKISDEKLRNFANAALGFFAGTVSTEMIRETLARN